LLLTMRLQAELADPPLAFISVTSLRDSSPFPLAHVV
jgi:hypothetical protein